MKTNLEEQILDYVHHRLSAEERKDLEKQAESSKEIASMIVLYQGLVKTGEDEAKEHQANELGWQKLSKAIDLEPKNVTPVWAKPKFNIWQTAAAVVFSVACWHGFISSSLYSPEGSEGYVTVGEESDRFLVMVSFQTYANIEDVEGLLRSIGAEIISGPTSLGLYQLSFRDGIIRDQGLARLRQENLIIETAHFSE